MVQRPKSDHPMRRAWGFFRFAGDDDEKVCVRSVCIFLNSRRSVQAGLSEGAHRKVNAANSDKAG